MSTTNTFRFAIDYNYELRLHIVDVWSLYYVWSLYLVEGRDQWQIYRSVLSPEDFKQLTTQDLCDLAWLGVGSLEREFNLRKVN